MGARRPSAAGLRAVGAHRSGAPLAHLSARYFQKAIWKSCMGTTSSDSSARYPLCISVTASFVSILARARRGGARGGLPTTAAAPHSESARAHPRRTRAHRLRRRGGCRQRPADAIGRATSRPTIRMKLLWVSEWECVGSE